MNNQKTLESITALAKRRGFVFPTSEIYGGLTSSYEYGPLGVELLRNIKNAWWQEFIHHRTDMVGLDSQILLHPKTWEASGHVDSFSDVMIDCRECQNRVRADHLIENHFESKGEKIDVEGESLENIDKIVADNEIKCSKCGNFNWTESKELSLLFETSIGAVKDKKSKAYLRGETAQGIFSNFKQILDSTRVKLPFGIGQIGKSFRNEITKGQFVFRTLEFEQAEIEYFFNPKEENWEELMGEWKESMWQFVTKTLGVSEENLRWRRHTDTERSFYSKDTYDLDYRFTFGFKELWGLAYRTDYDLAQHEKFSGEKLHYTDPHTGEKFLPHVIEPAGGINRFFLMVLTESYVEDEENNRTLLKLPFNLAPYKAAVFPLLANKPELKEKAKEVFNSLKHSFNITWDDRGNIGKRYKYQDEMGTPFCITIDFDTLEDDTVTIRDRDTAVQERVSIKELESYISQKIC